MAAEAEIYDLKGLKCPLPVLRSARRLAAMQPGQTLWIETTDPLATIDIPAFCAERRHRLVRTEIVESVQRFLIERGPEADTRA